MNLLFYRILAGTFMSLTGLCLAWLFSHIGSPTSDKMIWVALGFVVGLVEAIDTQAHIRKLEDR